jgi:hypothetical protein
MVEAFVQVKTLTLDVMMLSSRRQGSLGGFRDQGWWGKVVNDSTIAVASKYAGRNRAADKSLTGSEVGDWAERLVGGWRLEGVAMTGRDFSV